MKRKRLEFGTSTVNGLLSEGVEDLAVAHWEEVALHKEVIPLAVNWPEYRDFERKGKLKIFTLRRGEKLIGYNVFFLYFHVRYMNSLHAQNDVIYIDPEERGFAGLYLLRKTDNALKALGVVKITYHTKLHVLLGKGTKSGSFGTVLERLGYAHDESVYGKLL